jgi:hypothetical protein
MAITGTSAFFVAKRTQIEMLEPACIDTRYEQEI